MTNAEVLHQVEHGYRMPCPPGCPPHLYEIMLETWHKDPMKRPTFETLQWKLEDFFTLEGSEYKEASNVYWKDAWRDLGQWNTWFDYFKVWFKKLLFLVFSDFWEDSWTVSVRDWASVNNLWWLFCLMLELLYLEVFTLNSFQFEYDVING